MTDDASKAAQRFMKPELPKRFYKSAEAAREEDGYTVHLDGRPVRTPAKTPLNVPSEALALALAAEWNAQAEVIDPASMPLTRIVNSTIDGVARDVDAVREEIVRYSGSDLICYRADSPERLVERQRLNWDPILDWTSTELGAEFLATEGIQFVEQPEASREVIRATLSKLNEFQVAGLSVVTTLTGSALIALAVLKGRLDSAEAWRLAHVDEDWNIELWGEDEEARKRGEGRVKEMEAAVRLIALTT